jgi:hypothetical protein
LAVAILGSVALGRAAAERASGERAVTRAPGKGGAVAGCRAAMPPQLSRPPLMPPQPQPVAGGVWHSAPGEIERSGRPRRAQPPAAWCYPARPAAANYPKDSRARHKGVHGRRRRQLCTQALSRCNHGVGHRTPSFVARAWARFRRDRQWCWHRSSPACILPDRSRHTSGRAPDAADDNVALQRRRLRSAREYKPASPY